MRKLLWSSACLAAFLGLGSACSPGESITDGLAPPLSGSLVISIEGLPAGVSAAITVSGGQGYQHSMSTSGAISGLAPGNYQITAPDVLVDGDRYTATSVTQNVAVTAGAAAGAQVVYALVTTRLQLTLGGIPPSASPAVLITGPAGYSQTLSASATLTGLAPGSYQIQAPNILADGDQYQAQPGTLQVSLAPAALVPVTINYALATGHLDLQVSGVPAGAGPQITVSGPGGFTQSVPGSQLLSGLTPGTYLVSAAQLSANGQLYLPNPSVQSVAISPSPVAQPAAVTYAAVFGSLTITVAGLPNGVGASVGVSGPDGYSAALNGSQTLGGLKAGTYGISATPITSGGVIYSAAAQTATVTGGGNTALQVTYSATTGVLDVAIGGLPSGASANVIVIGPSGFSRALSSAQTLTGLVPGSYTIGASSVVSGAYTYYPTPTSQAVNLTAGTTTSAGVTYTVGTGALSVTVSGLPGGVNASVTVSGPGGFVQTLTGSQMLSGLAPGSYAVSAAAVTSGSSTYNPTPTSQTASVTSGTTASASTSYAVGTGALSVTVSGLPGGVNASVTVSGPGGFARTITATQTLSGLVPGSYAVSAAAVSSGGTTYNPVPASQTATVSSGATASASLSYAMGMGALSVTVSGLPSGVNASVTVSGPAGFVQTLTASQTLSGLAPGSYAVSAAAVTSGATTYNPTPTGQTASVTSGATASAGVSYAMVTGALSVTVSSLPSGVAASITVSGPGGFVQTLTASQTLSGLVPGSYAVSAAAVTSGGSTYNPTPTSQTASVTSGATASASVSYAVGVGALSVTVSSLPSGVAASVTVSGPGGFVQTLTASQTLSGLVPGSYAVSAAAVTSGGSTYNPTPASQTASVTSGATASASVSYAVVTGALSVTVSGLPSGVSANVTVSGPGGFVQTLTASQTLSGLVPGSYAVSAAAVTNGGSTYNPTPTSQTASVTSGATASKSVSYAVVTGALSVTVSGLPSGVSANVAVSGPGGYVQTLTASQTLSGLIPGSYAVSAVAVTSGGSTYSPTPTSQTASVTSGATASKSVSYAVGTGALSVTVSGLPSGVSANVAVSGPGGFVQTLTASQTLSGLVPGSYAVSAAAVTSGGTTYNPTPTSQTATVNSGATASASVGYTAAAVSTLDLTISGAYLIQATQRFNGTVPLVAGRDAYLRVYAIANQANSALPQVRVRLYQGAALVQTYTLAAPAGSVPTAVDESSLLRSWNVLVPAALIQPGLKLLADVDPANGVAESNESNNQFPQSGVAATVDVRALPTFAMRFVPVLQLPNGLQGNITTSNKDSFLTDLKQILPVGAYDVDLRAPYTTTTALSDGTTWSLVLLEMNALRTAEASTRYYYGVVKLSYSSGIAGMASVGGHAAVGIDDLPKATTVVAHEVGHNMGRSHAPCGGAGAPDPSYPYAGGVTGTWGLDLTSLTLKPPTQYDVMGYCYPRWISDYNWSAMLSYRQSGPNNSPSASIQASGSGGLLIWGRITNAGVVLEPAFRVAATASRLPAPGSNRLELLATDGSLLRSVPFNAAEVGDLPDGPERQFAFVVPLDAATQAALGQIRVVAGARTATRVAGTDAGADPGVTLSRPRAGEIELSWDASRFPVVMVKDATSGEILSFARGGRARIAAAGQSFALQFSDGVRTLSRSGRVLR
jgi:hypothetical protein